MAVIEIGTTCGCCGGPRGERPMWDPLLDTTVCRRCGTTIRGTSIPRVAGEIRGLKVAAVYSVILFLVALFWLSVFWLAAVYLRLG